MLPRKDVGSAKRLPHKARSRNQCGAVEEGRPEEGSGETKNAGRDAGVAGLEAHSTNAGLEGQAGTAPDVLKL
jgi:hypothetical protein